MFSQVLERGQEKNLENEVVKWSSFHYLWNSLHDLMLNFFIIFDKN